MSDSTSAERVLAILEMFAREKRPLSATELAEYCRIPASTCHGLVHILLRRSYLYQVGRRKDFYPTRRLFDVGSVIVANDQVLQRFEPAMEALRDATQETVVLGKRRKENIVYLEVLESPQTIRYSAAAGDSKPLHSTCIGKTILAELSPEDIREWWNVQPPEKVTDNTVDSYARLMADIEEGLRDGYFITRGENVPDVTALAIPVSINNERFGLAVAGPSPRVERHKEQIVDALKHAAASLRETADVGRVPIPAR